MRTEDDLRAALAGLECHTPDSQSVLSTFWLRSVVRSRHRNRSLIAGTVVSAIAMAATVVAVTLDGVGPASPVQAQVVTTALTYNGPGLLSPYVADTPAAVLRWLADRAAAQPTPALGPVLYIKTANWGIDFRRRHGGLNYRSRDFDIQRQWTSAGAQAITVTDPNGKLSPGLVPSGYTKIDPRNNPLWSWNNPATLPTSLAALRRHLLGHPRKPAGKPAIPISRPLGPPIPPSVFGSALELMTTEPLRPATRASLLRLMADGFQRAPRDSLVLGTVTDRAGHRGIAIASSTRDVMTLTRNLKKWKLVRTSSVFLTVYIFDPATGALSGVEYATCNGPVSDLATANARCQPDSYEQFLVIKAVRSVPRQPSAQGPATTRTGR
jgi:hypothetical protein